MTLSLLDLGNAPSDSPRGPRWQHVAGAVLVAAALLFAGPLRCTAPTVMPPRIVPDSTVATDATTRSPSATGIEG